MRVCLPSLIQLLLVVVVVVVVVEANRQEAVALVPIQLMRLAVLILVETELRTDLRMVEVPQEDLRIRRLLISCIYDKSRRHNLHPSRRRYQAQILRNRQTRPRIQAIVHQNHSCPQLGRAKAHLAVSTHL